MKCYWANQLDQMKLTWWWEWGNNVWPLSLNDGIHQVLRALLLLLSKISFLHLYLLLICLSGLRFRNYYCIAIIISSKAAHYITCHPVWRGSKVHVHQVSRWSQLMREIIRYHIDALRNFPHIEMIHVSTCLSPLIKFHPGTMSNTCHDETH